MDHSGLFITFEGIDGSGKTKHASHLETWLREEGYNAHLFREPGGTFLGDQVRKLLLDGKLELCLASEALLFLAARSQLVENVIRPVLHRGEIILLDRYIDSTIAYQGYGRGLPLDLLNNLNQFATEGLKPHLTFLMDVDTETGLKRCRSSRENDSDRFETIGGGFLERVRNGYMELSKMEPQRICMLDSRQEFHIVANQVRERTRLLLQGWDGQA